jgi:hypothetical protein
MGPFSSSPRTRNPSRDKSHNSSRPSSGSLAETRDRQRGAVLIPGSLGSCPLARVRSRCDPHAECRAGRTCPCTGFVERAQATSERGAGRDPRDSVAEA